MSQKRDIYFHEDDYCQQQLLPFDAAEFTEAELKRASEFADAHRAPNGVGWTAMYMIKDPPVELCTLKIDKGDLGSIISRSMPPFDTVYTGYSTHREECRKTSAWGLSAHCALFASWSDEGIVQKIWAEFFDFGEESILAATSAVTALAKCHPLIYVDWAWKYRCDAADEAKFASLLRSKLQTMDERLKAFKP